MTVLLFNSPRIGEAKDIFEMGSIYPRIGIASIGAHLRSHGHNVKILEPRLSQGGLDNTLEEVKRAKPDIVGIPAFTEEVHQASELAKLVKKVDPGITIVVGGPHPSAEPVLTLNEFVSFDAAVYGEGEETMLDLAVGKDLEKIPGIAFRRDDQVKLNEPRQPINQIDDLPFPSWDLYDLDRYRGATLSGGYKKAKKESLELPIEGSRGCPYPCVFCFRVMGRTMRFRSPSVVVDEIERDIEEFNADTVYFVEGTFGVNEKHAIALCEEIVKRELHKRMQWSCGARVDISEELLVKMKEAGCRFIGFGVESGDPEILKMNGKYISPEQTMLSFKVCEQLGIKTEANFILGHLGETRETVQKTIDLAKKLDATDANFAILVPFPGTEVYKMASKHAGGISIKTSDWRLYGKQLGAALNHDNLSTDELIWLQAKAYRGFYMRPDRLPKFIREKMSLKILYYGVKRVIGAHWRGSRTRN